MAEKFMTDEELAHVMEQAGIISTQGTTQSQQKRQAEQLRNAFAKTMDVKPYGQKIASPLSPISAIGQIAGGYMGGQAQQQSDQAAQAVANAQQSQNQQMMAAILRQGQGGAPAPAMGGTQGPQVPPVVRTGPPGLGLPPPAQLKPEGLPEELRQNPNWLAMLGL